jgi:protein-S-isoprenylcysteine O-methyltransferase Ste14
MANTQKQHKNDKIKQFVALIGGFLGALYLALQSVGITAEWFNPDSINAWLEVLNAGIPLLLIAYGIYKNTFVITDKARKQEQELERQGMK